MYFVTIATVIDIFDVICSVAIPTVATDQTSVLYHEFFVVFYSLLIIIKASYLMEA